MSLVRSRELMSATLIALCLTHFVEFASNFQRLSFGTNYFAWVEILIPGILLINELVIGLYDLRI